MAGPEQPLSPYKLCPRCRLIYAASTNFCVRDRELLVADPRTGEMKRFLVGPLGAEITGITATPDFRTLFINVQHPGEGSTANNLLSTWPDGPGKRPRSATVIITREDRKRLL